MLRKKHLACQQSAQLATLGYDQTIVQVQTEPFLLMKGECWQTEGLKLFTRPYSFIFYSYFFGFYQRKVLGVFGFIMQTVIDLISSGSFKMWDDECQVHIFLKHMLFHTIDLQKSFP